MKKYILFTIAGLLALIAIFAIYKAAPIEKSESKVTAKSIERRPKRATDKVALFAGGCFWSLESYFEKMPDGIVQVVSGYSGGATDNPTYENYVEEGHREVVEVVYDPSIISYGELVEYYFRHIDPTDSGGSFFDRGVGYTSAIYYGGEEEKGIAQDVIGIIENAKVFEKSIVTEVLPKSPFWPAEVEHQDYAANNEVRYVAYRVGSGRDAFLKKTWEGKEKVLYKEIKSQP